MAFDKPNEAKLLELISRTGYKMLQENGQRRFGPPRDRDHVAPPKGCEVFVGRIPRDCFEDELFPVFERTGTVFEMRLMMDFSGSNRGYAFVMYTTREGARRAVQELDNYEIRRGKHIGVCMSVDNCRLFVGGIPKTRTREEILAEMRRLTDGVVDVIVYPATHDRMKNRGFAFVEYATHRDAAMARRKLIPGRIQFFGQSIAVDWAEPERNVEDDVMSTVRVLYVRNLPVEFDESRIRQLFVEAIGDMGKQTVEKVRRIGTYAFVNCTTREYAELARIALHGRQLTTSNAAAYQTGASLEDTSAPTVLEVVFARPSARNNGRRGTANENATTVPNATSNNSRRNAGGRNKGAGAGKAGNSTNCKASLGGRKASRKNGAAQMHDSDGLQSTRRDDVSAQCDADSSAFPHLNMNAMGVCSVGPAAYYSYANNPQMPPSVLAADASTGYRSFRSTAQPLCSPVPYSAAVGSYASLANLAAYATQNGTYSASQSGFTPQYMNMAPNGFANGAGYTTAVASKAGFANSHSALNFAATYDANSNATPNGAAIFGLDMSVAQAHVRSAAVNCSGTSPNGLHPFADTSSSVPRGMSFSGSSVFPTHAQSTKTRQAHSNALNVELDGPKIALPFKASIKSGKEDDSDVLREPSADAHKFLQSESLGASNERSHSFVQPRDVSAVQYANMLQALAGVAQAPAMHGQSVTTTESLKAATTGHGNTTSNSSIVPSALCC